MQPIEVFYHLYIPDNYYAVNWHWFVDQQLSAIRNSKLSDIATINIAITMPRWWNTLDGDTIIKNSNEWEVQAHEHILFDEKVREYINMRYPFVNIIDIRDISQPNIYEGQTLELLHKRCSEVDINVLYIHSKGVRKSGYACVANWREVLNYFCITQWAKCLKNLETSDVVGVSDKLSHDSILSGNFWWSKSSYIKTLPEPLDSTKYVKYDYQYPDQPNYRFAFEYWVLANSPKIYHIASTDTNHYRNYCFLENIETK